MPPTLYWLYFVFALVTATTAIVNKKKGSPSLDLCPPHGNVNEKFDVEVLGTNNTEIIGSLTKQQNRRIDIVLSKVECENGTCKPKTIDHMTFDCISAWRIMSEEDGKEFIYATFFDQLNYKKGYSHYRCAMYEKLENTKVLRLAISKSSDCKGLKDQLLKKTYLSTKETPEWAKGLMILYISPKLEITKPVY